MCIGVTFAWRHLDTLPEWIQLVVRKYISFEDRSAASLAESTLLSKLVAYKLDYW